MQGIAVTVSHGYVRVFDTFDPLAPHLGKEMVDRRNAYFYCD